MFELGRIYSEDKKDKVHARNIWEQAFYQWKRKASQETEPDVILGRQILVYLARLEEDAGNFEKAIQYLQEVSKMRGDDVMQKQIDELRGKLNNRSSK